MVCRSDPIDLQAHADNTTRDTRHLSDVPGDRRVVEVIPDVVVHAVGHALEELGHVVAPAAGGAPRPGSVVQHGAVLHEADELGAVAHLTAQPSRHSQSSASSISPPEVIWPPPSVRPLCERAHCRQALKGTTRSGAGPLPPSALRMTTRAPGITDTPFSSALHHRLRTNSPALDPPYLSSWLFTISEKEPSPD